MLKFIVDESTGRAVARFLKDAGYDVVDVGEAMPRADDDRILSRALAEGRIVVTNDKDFGEKVFRDRRGHAGVLLLRPSQDRAATRVRIVEAVVAGHGDRLPGSFTVATERAVRIRRPPHPGH